MQACRRPCRCPFPTLNLINHLERRYSLLAWPLLALPPQTRRNRSDAAGHGHVCVGVCCIDMVTWNCSIHCDFIWLRFGYCGPGWMSGLISICYFWLHANTLSMPHCCIWKILITICEEMHSSAFFNVLFWHVIQCLISNCLFDAIYEQSTRFLMSLDVTDTSQNIITWINQKYLPTMN